MKVHDGLALTDAERMPWLERVAQKIDGWRESGTSGVLSCSALKRSYRDLIIGLRPEVKLVYLQGSYDLIRSRLEARRGHFMPAGLLASQFETLAAPVADERAIRVDVGASPTEIVEEIMRRLEAGS